MNVNAAEFYEEFKEALKFVDVGFQGMDQAELTVEGSKIIVSHGRLSAVIDTEEDGGA